VAESQSPAILVTLNPQALHSYGYGYPLHYYVYGGICVAVIVGFAIALLVALLMASGKRRDDAD